MHTQELPYSKNSAELFEHFVHLPYAVFFDSCLPQQNQGRYDIIAADPIKIISNSENIFEEIQQALKKLTFPPPLPLFLPFTIGAIGYFSYDICRSLEKIPVIAINDITLPQAVVGIYNWSIVVDHHANKTYFNSANTFDHPSIKKILALLHSKPTMQEKFSLTQTFTSNMSREYYQHAFDKIKKHIVAGDCYQVNLAQRFSAEFTGSSWNAYKILREKNPAPYAAFMQLENAAILSLSPERFIKITDSVVETKPIKGTAKRFSDAPKDKISATELLSSEKDRAENVMIVDLLRNDLSRTCIAGSVQVSQLCALETFSAVHHLVSTITGELPKDQTSLNLLQSCFPGGSITGAPKIAAMTIIESLEPHRRSIYCGNLFYVDISGNCDSNIAIRTVICDKNKIHCYAGGGIVYDSDCEKEYAETWAKVGKIISILNSQGRC